MTRRRALIAGGGMAVFLAAFLAGRWTAHPPAAVVSDSKASTAASQASASSATAAHVEAIAHESATGDVDTKATTTRKWFPAVPAKSGCPELPAHVEETTTTETHAVTARTADKQRSSVATKKQEQQSATRQTVVELHTVTPVRPAWSVSLMPGAQLFGTKAVTLFGPAVLGASVEHRFIGPVSMGLWGSTSGAAGITLRGDIP